MSVDGAVSTTRQRDPKDRRYSVGAAAHCGGLRTPPLALGAGSHASLTQSVAARPRNPHRPVIEIVPATMTHAALIRLRDGDARELEALGVEKMEAIEASLARSIEADTYLLANEHGEREVAAVMGVAMTSFVGGIAVPWLLTGPPVNRVKKDFLRLTRERIGRMKARYGYLENHVHADYAEALRWLRWLGFETAPAAAFGPKGAPFVRIWMGEPHAV